MSTAPHNNTNQYEEIFGLDVGDARIGVARANTFAKIAYPLTLVKVDGSEIKQIKDLAKEHRVSTIVVGLPRTLDGKETAQTKKTKEFINKLKASGFSIIMQDEANTSNLAKENILARSKSKVINKGQIDMEAACIILEQYLRQLK